MYISIHAGLCGDGFLTIDVFIRSSVYIHVNVC